MSEGGERLRHLSRYEVIEPLGRGGMGEVYKARDLDRDRIVALKTLRKFDPRALLRFKAEFRSVARLKHANLVRLGELHIDDHAWAFSMEYVDGTDFVSWVQGSKYRDFEVEFGAPPLSGTSSQSSLDAPAASATPLCTERPAPTHKEMRRDAPDLPPLRELSDVEMSSSMELPSFTQDTQGKSLGISPTEAPPVSKPARELFGTISDTAVSDEDTSLAHGVPLLTPSDSDASDPSGAQVLPTTATVPQPATASSQVPTLSKPATADAPSPAASASVPTSVHMNRVRYALGQLALGVQTVHDAGLLHLDIKPGNVMVTGEGRVVLLDFGLVRSLEPLRVRERPRVVGTPAYMAPEQGMAKLPTTASDWYAVGSLLYKSLTGRHPFLGDRTAVLLAKQDQLPPAVSTLNPDVPEDLEALCMDLLAPRPEDRPTGPEILQRLHMPYEPVESGRTRELFGRSDELAAFTELVERLHRREPSIVHVRGLSGMGKSRLVQGFLENLGHPEFSVLEGRCFELETVPYNAFDRVIDSLVQLLQTEFGEIVDDLRTELQSVGRLFPVVRGLLPAPLSLPPPTDVQAARRHALNSLKTILYRLALDTPLVISIDDLQWSDSDSAALLTELFSAPHPVPMLLVVSYRADEVSECVALDTLRAIERRGLVSVQHIDVGPIDPDAAMTFARHVLGPNAPSHLPSDLVHEADGNPLFLEELCIHAQRGDLVTSPTLQEIIRERARDLDVADRTLLEVLAVAQQPLALEVALEAADVDAAESLEIIRSLEHQHLIRTRGPRLEDVAEVYHDRIRELLLSDLSAERRASLSASLATSLRSRAADPERLAEYFLAAGDTDRATEYLVLAATGATRALAFGRAAKLLVRATELSPDDPELRLQSARALRDAGQGEEAAIAYLDTAADRAPEEAIRVRGLAVEAYLTSGQIEEGTQHYRALLSEVGLSFPKTHLGAIFGLLWQMVTTKIRGSQFTTDFAREVPRETADRLDLLLVGGKGFLTFNPVLGGWFWYRLLTLARKAGDARRTAHALGQVGLSTSFPASAGALAKGSALLSQAESIAEDLEDAHLSGSLRCIRGIAAIAALRFDKCRKLLESGLDTFNTHSVGARWERTVSEHTRLHAMCWAGNLRECFDEAQAWSSTAPLDVDIVSRVSFQPFVALAELAEDFPTRARETTEEAMRTFSRRFFTPMHAHALRVNLRIDVYQGNPARALERLEDAWPSLRRGFLLGLKLWRIEFTGIRAQLHAVMANRGQRGAARKAHRYIRSLKSERAAWADGAAETALGTLALADGRHADVLRHYDAAIKAYREAGLHAHAVAVALQRASVNREMSANGVAAQWLQEQGVIDPARFARALVPSAELE